MVQIPFRGHFVERGKRPNPPNIICSTYPALDCAPEELCVCVCRGAVMDVEIATVLIEIGYISVHNQERSGHAVCALVSCCMYETMWMSYLANLQYESSGCTGTLT